MAVWEENEIVRRGLIASLSEDGGLQVATAALQKIDVAVVSREAAEAKRFPCPVVVCSENLNEHPGAAENANDVVGVLDRSTLTGAQLRATVRAAAAGLRISGPSPNRSQPQLDPRSKHVLELLAEGHSTREIATKMSYSERTIKKLIMGLLDYFQARSRAQVVARAIRSGVI